MIKKTKKKKVSGLRSKFEDKVALELIEAGVDFTYESKKITYVLTHTYTPDFILANGVIVETKGYFDAADRGKHLAIKKALPEADIRFVFMRANTKVHKNSKLTYGDWATKHGFIWAEGSIPLSWAKE